MIIAIIGSRKYSRLDLVEEYIKNLPKGTKVISGGAIGVDKTAIDAAKKYGFEWEEYKAKWQDLKAPNAKIKMGKFGLYNSMAGFDRNTILVEKADVVVAFWDGKSKGSLDTIRKAFKVKKLNYYFNDNGDVIQIERLKF